jgi:DNA-binding CsgD family transcriptional regulator
VAALGAAKVVLPQRFFLLLNEAGLVGIQLYAILVIVKRIKGIGHPRLLTLVRSIVATAVIMAAAMAMQAVGQVAFPAPEFLRSYPFAQVLFYLATVGFLLFHSVNYLFKPEVSRSYRLPEQIVKQYGISPREREIITMLVKGYPNKVIGEKLFISSTTVKNHIYHIYQKTGVTNKIQLINLINSPK